MLRFGSEGWRKLREVKKRKERRGRSRVRGVPQEEGVRGRGGVPQEEGVGLGVFPQEGGVGGVSPQSEEGNKSR